MDPSAQFDPLSHPERLETKALDDAADLEKSLTPKYGTPERRPALDSETVLAETDRFTPTGKSYDNRKIYRDGDGRLYYVDNFHEGSGSEIEVFSRNGEHLGTMTPGGVFDATRKVKGRVLTKDLL